MSQDVVYLGNARPQPQRKPPRVNFFLRSRELKGCGLNSEEIELAQAIEASLSCAPNAPTPPPRLHPTQKESAEQIAAAIGNRTTLRAILAKLPDVDPQHPCFAQFFTS
jgi:hypothetical protein